MLYSTLPRNSTPSLFNQLASAERDFDRVFSRFFGNTQPNQMSGWWPASEVQETQNGYCVTLELPGCTTDQINVSVENGLLTISGERRREVAENAQDVTYHLTERPYGQFTRTFVLPSTVDADELSARYEHGILTVQLPKAEQAKPRRIEIQSGEGQGRISSGN